MKLLLSFLISFSALAADYAFDLNAGFPVPISTEKFEKSVDPSLSGNFALRWLRDENLSFGIAFHFIDFTKSDVTDNNLYAIARYDSTQSNEYMSVYANAGLGLASVDGEDEEYQRLSMTLGSGMKMPLGPQSFWSLNFNYYYVPGKGRAPEQHIIAPMIGLTWLLSPDMKMAEPITNIISDADFDGVSDRNDQCANTPEGSTVNQFGCQDNEEIKIFVDVKFGLESARLDESYTQSLDTLAETLKKHSTVKVEIQGHSDNTGEASFNVSLSQKRADAVRDYLVNIHAIQYARLSSKGYGPKFPKYSNATKLGREKNRRVEAKIILK